MSSGDGERHRRGTVWPEKMVEVGGLSGTLAGRVERNFSASAL